MKLAILISILCALLSVASATAISTAQCAASSHYLEARAKFPAKKPPPLVKPPPVTKPPVNPKPPTKSTPNPGKPSPTPKKPTKSTSTKGTPTSTLGKVPISKTCYQIAILRQQEEPDDQFDSNRLRSARLSLSRRAIKGSIGPQGPCNVPKFTSNPFESFGKKRSRM
jgi:hypothetical protein